VGQPEGLAEEEAFTFEYSALRDGQFTVAVDRRWFAREVTTHADCYIHDGLSLTEMIVPGAVVRPITTRQVKLTLEGFPHIVAVPEETESVVWFTLANVGNRPTRFALGIGANTPQGDAPGRGTAAGPTSARLLPFHACLRRRPRPGRHRTHQRQGRVYGRGGEATPALTLRAGDHRAAQGHHQVQFLGGGPTGSHAAGGVWGGESRRTTEQSPSRVTWAPSVLRVYSPATATPAVAFSRRGCRTPTNR